MPVHYCGNACNMDAVLEFAQSHRLPVVEDAAHAFGSSWRGRRLGSFGDITCFSFDPTKNITCGDGGAICTADDLLADLMRCKRVLGMSRDGWQRKDSADWKYEVSTQGYRYHMSNINAAIGVAQLERFDGFLRRKREIVSRYNKDFSGIRGIELLEWDLDEAFPSLYIIRILDGRRTAFMESLKARGVATAVHFPPNHLQPHFRTNQRLPHTEQLAHQIVSLPLFCDMSNDDVAHVIASVAEFFALPIPAP
jgi:dTDP-4-amino-4,6-dideoxygalactose transaminase